MWSGLLIGNLRAQSVIADNPNVTLQLSNVTLIEFFNKLTEVTGKNFVYSADILEQKGRVSVTVENERLDKVLDRCLKEKGLGYTFQDDVILIYLQNEKVSPGEKVKKRLVRGVVRDQQGDPLVGATVVLKNTHMGVATDVDGRFEMEIMPETEYLVFSFIGKKEKEVSVKKHKELEVVLEDLMENLEDVVITGYGNISKSSFTGNSVSIKREDLLKVSKSNVIAALQTFDPSFRIQENNQWGSDPNAIPEMYIRGRSGVGIKELDKDQLSKSQLENNPNLPLFIMDGFEISARKLYDFDPNRIENVTILKDAAATAMYGSRAANGVILVTTKRSSTERFTVTYKGTVGWQSPTDLPETVNALEYRELTNAMNLQDGNAPTYDDESMALYRKNMGKDPDLYPNTDWQDAVLTGSGLSHSHTVSLGIGSERVRMLTTLGYVDQNGIIETTDFQRYTFRNNADVKFNDKLSMKLDLSFSNGDRRSSPYQGTIFNYMNTRSADIPNQFSTGLYNGLGLQGNNPVALMLEGGQNKNNTLRLSGAITLTYEPVEWLSLQGMLAPRYATTNKHNWKKPVTTYQDMEGTATLTSTPYATLTESGSRAFYGNYNFLMTFKKNFSGHDLKLILGAERNTYDYKYLSAYRQVFNYPDYDQIDVGEIENMDNSGHRYEWAIQSYFGRLNYNFKERYLLEANLRIDGSSRFSKSNRWGYFPSVSGAWRISEEPFMENAKHILDGLKIRASYGTLGNQNLAGGDAASYYPTTPNLALGHISMNGTPASLVTLNTLANPDIKWETTTMLDVGVDVTLFSKLNITADWYRKNTDDILMKLDIPAGVGLNAPYQNAGKVRNTGWELSIGYNNRWRDFTFGVQANVSDVKNEIVDMRGKTSTSGVLRNQEGYSIGSIYALESLGIIRTQEEADWVNANCPQFKETVQIGDIRYADIDGSNTIDENDKTIVGSTIPRYTYSLNLDFGWKGLRLSMLFQGVGKTDGYLNTYYVMPSNQGGTFRKEHIDFACAANPGGVTPRLTSANKNNWYDSSFWMKSAAYLRLKNIQLGYDLPKSWMRKIGLKSAYVYVNAQNLFTATNFWDGYDPEVGYDGDASGDFDLVKLGSANNYPQVKLVTIGLDLKF